MKSYKYILFLLCLLCHAKQNSVPAISSDNETVSTVGNRIPGARHDLIPNEFKRESHLLQSRADPSGVTLWCFSSGPEDRPNVDPKVFEDRLSSYCDNLSSKLKDAAGGGYRNVVLTYPTGDATNAPRIIFTTSWASDKRSPNNFNTDNCKEVGKYIFDTCDNYRQGGATFRRDSTLEFSFRLIRAVDYFNG